MQDKMEQVLRTVLKRITPKKSERAKIEALAKKLERKVAAAARESDVRAKIRVEGSVAKDTWLNMEPDIDVFMRVPTSIPRKSLGDVCLKIARKATESSEQIERFAEHPYLEAIVEGVRVNIVPCYEVKGGEWLSATDRTPFHTDYMKKRLDDQMRDEVRLLKKFMKGIGVYGAEIKVGGFSGYLCELFVLHFGSFLNVLKAFAELGQKMVIDIEHYYKNRDNELGLLFGEPLVIVDPVDRARNVASAVRPEKLQCFVVSSRAFLRKPSLDFFYPPKTKALTARQLEKRLKKRGSAIVFVTFSKVESVPDVLWGQLFRSQRSLRKLVELSDFVLLRNVVWSDEKSLSVFVFEVEQSCIPPVKKHLGPPIEKESECEKFLQKHKNGVGTVCGPYIEDGRWVVMVRRKHTKVVELLRERLKDGGKNAGIADQISKKLREGFEILVSEEILGVYRRNVDFAQFLTGFLDGRPLWLEAT
jgi:tRNA nucleotidyltransferase (CCA-adding enzyme)